MLDVRNLTQAAAWAWEAQLLEAVCGEQGQVGSLVSHNLPAQWTSFVGRERQIAEKTNLLQRARLVTLTGAARLLGASAAMLETMGMPYPPSDRDEVALYVTDISSQLDEETFSTAWAEGQAMSMTEAIAYVLEEAVLKPQQAST